MEVLLILLISAILSGIVDFINSSMSDLIDLAFLAEQHISYYIDFNGLYNLFCNFGISLIILKFLKKGFETYILWTDGDPDADPLLLLVNFIKALAVALGFRSIYYWLVDVAKNLINDLFRIIGGSTSTLILNTIMSGGLFIAIMDLIVIIMYLLLYVQCLVRGVEMIVLRLGLPLACVGLIDNDKGIFKSYITKFIQSLITVIVQLSLMRLGLTLIMNMYSVMDTVWAIAIMSVALATPKFLNEFMLTAGSGAFGSAANKAYQTIHLVQIVKGIIK